ncbi:MAG: Gfo/Idh/MocA family oxidoreductase [Eubacteriales bacterium]|nr:Gfo/Idh/MocA family oxidoreductase [Eubacteriales bacterium]
MGRKYLRYGMVGGSLGAFIGGVHRKAIALDETAQLVAGCFSSHEDKNKECGEFYRLDSDRIYADYEAMAEGESKREDGIDFVCITTPNNTHYAVAKCFLEHGIHVSCEKPLCFTVEEAKELQRLADEKGLLFCVTYTYTGYNMVKLARDLVRAGEIGEVININCEYLQEWLIDSIGASDSATSKMSVWRANPAFSGQSNCVGDIGTHVESVVSYITGLHVTKVAAVLDKFGQELDLNANMLVELSNGAHGVISSSQVCAGHANGLVIRIFGTEGAIEWHQEDPNYLTLEKKGKPIQTFDRGCGYIEGRAADVNRIPSGHPEGLMVAFANIYQSFINAILKKVNGEELTEADLDFPDVTYGVRGVEFVTAVVKSDKANAAWTEL